MKAYGKVVSVGDRLGVRYERRLKHGPEKVWRALTEDAELKGWFPVKKTSKRTSGSRGRSVAPPLGHVPAVLADLAKVIAERGYRRCQSTW